MKPSKTSKGWMLEHVNDHYVHLAQKDGYRSRAAYKLLEIDDKDRLLSTGAAIADLGSAPGSWAQVARKRVGDKGRVFALDILPMDPIAGVDFLQGDFREDSVLETLEKLLDGRKLDVVISDLAPNISGMAVMDQARAYLLTELALDFAVQNLRVGGHFLVKVFQGGEFNDYLKLMRSLFDEVATRKPKASRDRSNETYLLGKGLRANAAAGRSQP